MPVFTTGTITRSGRTTPTKYARSLTKLSRNQTQPYGFLTFRKTTGNQVQRVYLGNTNWLWDGAWPAYEKVYDICFTKFNQASLLSEKHPEITRYMDSWSTPSYQGKSGLGGRK
jgi:hypothetical protein